MWLCAIYTKEAGLFTCVLSISSAAPHFVPPVLAITLPQSETQSNIRVRVSSTFYVFILTRVWPSDGHTVQIGRRLTSDLLTTAQSKPKNGIRFDMKYSENVTLITIK